MRILHIMNHTFRLNGNVHAAVDLACAQSSQGHEVAVCSGGGDFDDLLRANDISIIEIDQRRRPARLIGATWELYGSCRAWKPQVIHAHMMTSCVIAWPVTRALRIPLVTTIHNAFEKGAILMGLGDRVIAVSGAVKSMMVGRGVSKKRLRVVLNGTVGSARLPPPKPVAEILRKPAIVTVCGLHPRKGLIDLINAFKMVAASQPEACLYIVGEGPMRVEYEALAKGLGLGQRIVFVGKVSDPRPHLLGSDIFVLASHADPAPLVLSEAREAGCAIVATNVDGIPEMLNGGQAGILVPPHDPDAIAAALLSLLRNPAELYRFRQQSVRDIQTMSVARVARDTLGVYQECVRA